MSEEILKEAFESKCASCDKELFGMIPFRIEVADGTLEYQTILDIYGTNKFNICFECLIKKLVKWKNWF